MSTDHPSPDTDPAPLPDAVTPILPDASAPATPAEGAAATADPVADAVPPAGAVPPADAVPAADAPAPDADARGATPAPAAPRMDLAACAAELKQRFPALFGGAPKPIKLRIQADIQARAPAVFPRQALSAFLHRHTTSTLYLIALSQQPHRLDLDGQPAGEVAAEHRDAAAHEVERRRALRKEREAQMHEARRAAIQAEREAARQKPGPAEDRHPGRNPSLKTDQKADQPARQPRRGPTGEAASAAPRPPARPRRDARPTPRPAQDRRPAPRAPEPAATALPAQPAAAERPRDEDPARRDRARLLRDFEASPLTKANFCVLKRIKPEDLDAQLAQARQEAAAWAAAHPRPPRDRRPDAPRGAPTPHPKKDRAA